MIPYSHRNFVYIDDDLLTVPHHVFIYCVIKHLFKKHINTIVGVSSIPQLPDIHTGTTTNMLLPIKCPYCIRTIFQSGGGYYILFHITTAVSPIKFRIIQR